MTPLKYREGSHYAHAEDPDFNRLVKRTRSGELEAVLITEQSGRHTYLFGPVGQNNPTLFGAAMVEHVIEDVAHQEPASFDEGQTDVEVPEVNR